MARPIMSNTPGAIQAREDRKRLALEGKGENVALRQARQKEYRARQGEVHALLQKLWRLRAVRERGLVPGVVFLPSWDELAIMLRALIHEEELISAAVGGRGAAAGGLPGADAAAENDTPDLGRNFTEEARNTTSQAGVSIQAAEGGAGLSTLHNTPRISTSNTKHSKPKKDTGHKGGRR